jgi:hypothetical protein
MLVSRLLFSTVLGLFRLTFRSSIETSNRRTFSGALLSRFLRSIALLPLWERVRYRTGSTYSKSPEVLTPFPILFFASQSVRVLQKKFRLKMWVLPSIPSIRARNTTKFYPNRDCWWGTGHIPTKASPPRLRSIV